LRRGACRWRGRRRRWWTRSLVGGRLLPTFPRPLSSPSLSRTGRRCRAHSLLSFLLLCRVPSVMGAAITRFACAVTAPATWDGLLLSCRGSRRWRGAIGPRLLAPSQRFGRIYLAHSGACRYAGFGLRIRSHPPCCSSNLLYTKSTIRGSKIKAPR
jgi:hypothetical protein